MPMTEVDITPYPAAPQARPSASPSPPLPSRRDAANATNATMMSARCTAGTPISASKPRIRMTVQQMTSGSHRITPNHPRKVRRAVTGNAIRGLEPRVPPERWGGFVSDRPRNAGIPLPVHRVQICQYLCDVFLPGIPSEFLGDVGPRGSPPTGAGRPAHRTLT
jgi:hypothetical protein